MDSGKAAYKRSVQNILINRPMQREFTLVMLGIMMTAAFAVGIVINLTLGNLTDNAPTTISRTTLERIIFDANAQLVVISILIIFLAVIATGFFGVFFLHRIAGPVYRFRQVLKRMGSGEIPPEVRLRRKDFFKETADELNRVIHVLKEYESVSHKMDGLLIQLSKSVPSQPELSATIKEVHNQLASLKKSD
ncbi:MAG: hypothetical protein A3C35_04375 [Omnitrophica bacterium RIFCSPHIGHO2_02_FULL_46_11]|nr:MAG: hypothetical protein A3A81_07820 [Omnitrophica bacterium RIFCSPLOWO2_01_FULL_45_10b]OGW87048.1 MAG: hypothetical protein A3C35_04375 [Omnitrophica bacterium RIFCSPHIGHO2_02_FULL_46_11]